MSNYPQSNPYVSYQGGAMEPAVFSAFAMNALRGTKGWALFIAIMFYIFAGFAVIATFGAFIAAANIPAGRGAPPMGIIAFVYLVAAAIYLSIGLTIQRYVNAITRVSRSGTTNDLESAINAQRRVWKFFGIMIIVGISLYLLMIAIFVAAFSRF